MCQFVFHCLDWVPCKCIGLLHVCQGRCFLRFFAFCFYFFNVFVVASCLFTNKRPSNPDDMRLFVIGPSHVYIYIYEYPEHIQNTRRRPGRVRPAAACYFVYILYILVVISKQLPEGCGVELAVHTCKAFQSNIYVECSIVLTASARPPALGTLAQLYIYIYIYIHIHITFPEMESSRI